MEEVAAMTRLMRTGWRHCMSNTFGTWLPGDPRGFRTRRHREHVEGDYRNPPARSTYERRHEAARKRMRPAPVVKFEPRTIEKHVVLH
jgi:hypothetical protein